MNRGINISTTTNTDNRGISNTCMTMEFLKAAQMSEDGISKWDLIQIVKNGVESSFLPQNKKREMIMHFEKEIMEIIIEEYL